ncbi:insulinase family protein [Candidatus Similichlamydia epinepheli]|uniref:insulinase family protein n=1 Tax=Candidatus Similichlamydia epinepheli TaxID=1903953 RepID=UPI00130069F3|nr:insulinase family protein [Candidatus Similichlamydia epinepheli]
MTKRNFECPYLVKDQNPYQTFSPRLQKIKQEKWVLRNGIILLLAEDPDASQFGVGLLTKTGSADDPIDAPGTAHFVEHMLAGRTNGEFSDGINEFVLGQGGTYNALTSMGITFYAISLGHNLFEQTAKRLFAMFQNPLFLEDETKAELAAIDEEFYIHSMNDGFRVWSGILSQMNKGFPIQHYHPGNRLLLGKQSGASLRKWFENHYTSRNATCAAISARPIEEMRQLILPLAEKIPVRMGWKRSLPPYEQKESRFIFVKTLQGTNCLLVVWTYHPNPFSEKQQDLYLLIHLINSDHPGGLSYKLKESGLAEICEGSIELLGESLPALFCFEVKLTDKGVKEWKSVYSIMESFLQWASQIDPEHASRTMKELKSAQILAHQYRGKTQPFDFVLQATVALSKEPLATFPFYSVAPQNFNYSSYQQAVKKLQQSNRIVLLGSSFGKWSEAKEDIPGKPQKKEDLKEMPNWGYKCFDSPLPKLKKEVHEFIPPGFQRFLPEIVPQPYRIEKNSTLAFSPEEIIEPSPIYLVRDVFFGVPKDYLRIRMKHIRFLKKDPQWHLLAETWGRVVNKSLDDLEYLARTSGNSVSLGPKTPYSLDLALVAWETKSEELMQEMLNQVRQAKITQKELDRVIEEIRLEIESIESSPPFRTASRIFEENIQEVLPTLQERKTFIEEVSLNDLKKFSGVFISEASFEVFYLGQRNKKSISKLVNPLAQSFKAHFLPEMRSDPVHYGLELGEKIVRFPSTLPGHAARLSVDCGSALSPEVVVCNWILAAGFDPIVMDQLREKEELAYVARCGSQESTERIFLTILTQSTKVSCDFLLKRYYQLIEELLSKLGTEPFFHKDKFEALRASCLELLESPSTSGSDFLKRVYHLGVEKRKNWNFDVKAVEVVKKLTFHDFVEGSLQENKE